MSNRNGNGRSRNENGKSRSNGSVEDLWQKFLSSERTDVGLRNRLIELYLPIAAYAAARSSRKLPVDYDDLFQMAVLGLMEAVQSFDPSSRAKFETFASHRVNGSIIDAIRDQDWVSRTWRHRKRELARIRKEFTDLYDREPTVAELAESLNLPPEKVRELIDRNHTIVSLDMADEDGHRLIQPTEEATEEGELFTGLEAIKHHLKGLNDLERTIVLMYYDEGFSMSQIGSFLGLSHSRISQILKSIILFLRRKMKRRETLI